MAQTWGKPPPSPFKYTMCLTTGLVPKCHFVLKLGLPWLWGPITLRANLQLRRGLKQNCSARQELFNSMLHAIYTRGNWGDSWILVVGNQIANLTPNLSFGHNLCLRCLNESWEPILNIYVSRAFQWYKELLNPMGFDPYDCSLKIQESIMTPTPKVGTNLGMWGFIPSHSLTLTRTWDVTPGLPSWPAPLPWSRAQG
jgi:hypothetical protein